MTFLRPILFIFVLALPGGIRAEIITFDFESAVGAGNDLDGLAAGTTSVSSGGITLTLSATASLLLPEPGDTVVFNRTGSAFGLDVVGVGGGDDSDGIDLADGRIEQAAFQISSNVALQSLSLLSMRFRGFGVSESGSVTVNGADVTAYPGGFTGGDLSSRILTINQTGLSVGDVVAINPFDGAFGLELITFNATATAAVPEPGTLLAASVFVVGLLVRRVHRSNLLNR